MTQYIFNTDDPDEEAVRDTLIVINWYAAHGRTPELRLRAAQVALAHDVLDVARPGWRKELTTPHALFAPALAQSALIGDALPQLDVPHALSVWGGLLGGLEHINLKDAN